LGVFNVEIAINQLIKIILGVLVVASVIIGLYLFFSGSILDFFNNLIPDVSPDKIENPIQLEDEQEVAEEVPIKSCKDCGIICFEKECLNLGDCKYDPWSLNNRCMEIK